MHVYPRASALSTLVKISDPLAWVRADWGAAHALTTSSCRSERSRACFRRAAARVKEPRIQLALSWFVGGSHSRPRSDLGFLMTTEGQDLGLTSHPKD